MSYTKIIKIGWSYSKNTKGGDFWVKLTWTDHVVRRMWQRRSDWSLHKWNNESAKA